MVCTAVFLAGFLSRVALGPLLPAVQTDLALDYTQAGAIFSWLSGGLSLALFLSGFVSSRLTHRTVIAMSGYVAGSGLLFAATAHSLTALEAGMFVCGFGGGLYLPSGLATLTRLAPSSTWGRVLAIHETAPNLSFILAPLLAEAVLLLFGDWRMGLGLLGIGQITLATAFVARFGHGRFRGEEPRLDLARTVLGRYSVMVLAVGFVLALGSELGPFNMMTLFLTEERGFDRQDASLVLAASRVACVAVTFGAGWLTDRIGARRMIAVSQLTCGLSTAGLGLFHGSGLMAAVFAQPLAAALFFPAGFTALARMFVPEHRGMATSVILTLGVLIGSGFTPAMLGWFGDNFSFALGFEVQGAAVLLATPLSALLLPASLDRPEDNS